MRRLSRHDAGYLVHMPWRRQPGRRLPGALRWSILTLAAVSTVAAAYVLYQAATISSAWNSIERVSLDAPDQVEASPSVPGSPAAYDLPDPVTPTPTARDSAPVERETTAVPPSTTAATETSRPEARMEPESEQTGTTTSTTHTTSQSTPSTESSRTTILAQAEDPPSVMALIGSDSRSGLEDLEDFGDFEGQRADVIMLAIRSGDDSSLLSIPRDLYVPDTCGGGRHRIGDAYVGCGERHGLANVVHELEEVTGLPIEHAAAVDLAGFQSVVDVLGGYEICNEHALRDPKSGLRLEPGCELADGETTLAWLRSRHTEQRIGGDWRPVAGVSDLSRNERQRGFLVDIFERLGQGPSPQDILEALRSAAPYLTIDDRLSMTDAAAWIWEFRDATVSTHEIPVRNETTPGGAQVLVPTTDAGQLADELISR